VGWARCGTDDKGREIGYAISATCDHHDCDKRIDRGISYACGGHHLSADVYCERYFCADHMWWCEVADSFVCAECLENNKAIGNAEVVQLIRDLSSPDDVALCIAGESVCWLDKDDYGVSLEFTSGEVRRFGADSLLDCLRKAKEAMK